MFDTRHSAYEQVERLTARINEVAADYSRTQIKRTLLMQAGDVRQARHMSRRLHLLNSELAYLVGALRQSDAALSMAECGQ